MYPLAPLAVQKFKHCISLDDGPPRVIRLRLQDTPTSH